MVSAILQSPGLFVSDVVGDLSDRVRPSIVAVRDGRRGSGTGVVWSSDLVITNYHVVTSDRAELVFADGREAVGQVAGRDPHNDIVALRVDDAPTPALIGDSTALRIGQIVVAVGYPLGIDHAITVGVVSALPAPSDPRAMIRSDLHLNPGNSGGPLVAADGSVVGINAMVAGPGTALSIPEHTVQAFLARLSGNAPTLGLELTAVRLPARWRDAFSRTSEHGLLVTEVMPGSVAETAGMYPGDLLVAVNDHPAAFPLRLREAIAMVGSDSPLRLRLIRGGQPLEVAIREVASM